jgi:hypothetical protein
MRTHTAVFLKLKLVFAFHAGEAFAAIHRTVLTGFERNLRFVAAVGADSGVHFSFGSGSVFASVTARFAALGLVYKAFFGIEFLLTGGEHKFGAAFFADQSFVFVHCFYLALNDVDCPGEIQTDTKGGCTLIKPLRHIANGFYRLSQLEMRQFTTRPLQRIIHRLGGKI